MLFRVDDDVPSFRWEGLFNTVPESMASSRIVMISVTPGLRYKAIPEFSQKSQKKKSF